MEIILIQDVNKLGQKDDLVNVKDGYGRNFLIPRGFQAVQGLEVSFLIKSGYHTLLIFKNINEVKKYF